MIIAIGLKKSDKEKFILRYLPFCGEYIYLSSYRPIVPASTFDPKSRTPDKHQTVIKVMARDIPVDVPDESLEPHGRLTLDELLNQWDDIRKKLQGLLAEIK